LRWDTRSHPREIGAGFVRAVDDPFLAVGVESPQGGENVHVAGR